MAPDLTAAVLVVLHLHDAFMERVLSNWCCVLFEGLS